MRRRKGKAELVVLEKWKMTTTSATISWTTNEVATGKIYYSNVNPLNFATASTANDAAYTLGHSFHVVGLTASTTYYYALESKDGSNNTATSSSTSFVTTN